MRLLWLCAALALVSMAGYCSAASAQEAPARPFQGEIPDETDGKWKVLKVEPVWISPITFGLECDYATTDGDYRLTTFVFFGRTIVKEWGHPYPSDELGNWLVNVDGQWLALPPHATTSMSLNLDPSNNPIDVELWGYGLEHTKITAERARKAPLSVCPLQS